MKGGSLTSSALNGGVKYTFNKIKFIKTDWKEDSMMNLLIKLMILESNLSMLLDRVRFLIAH